MPPSPPPPATWGDELPSPTVSVVIPALNEEGNLPLVLEGLPPVDEVIIVDGGSADDTVAIAREVRPDAKVVRQTRTGKGNALICGFAASTCDIVVTLNADGSTDPGEIPRYVDALLAGAEVAHGSRYREGGGNLDEGRWDRVGNRTYNRLVNVLFGTRFTDLGYGYNAFWRTLLPVLDLPAAQEPGLRRGTRLWGDGPEIEPLINIRMAAQGLRVVEVASVGYPRIYGTRERRPMQESSRAVRTAVAEYVRRRRISRGTPLPPGALAITGSTTPATADDSPGARTRGTRARSHAPRHQSTPPAMSSGFVDDDVESSGRHSIERAALERLRRGEGAPGIPRRRHAAGDVAGRDPGTPGGYGTSGNYGTAGGYGTAGSADTSGSYGSYGSYGAASGHQQRAEPDRQYGGGQDTARQWPEQDRAPHADDGHRRSGADDQRAWREFYTDPDAAAPAGAEVPEQRSGWERRRRLERRRTGDLGPYADGADPQSWHGAGRRGRRDLTVIPGEGRQSPDGTTPPGRPSHLRAVPGERFGGF